MADYDRDTKSNIASEDALSEKGAPAYGSITAVVEAHDARFAAAEAAKPLNPWSRKSLQLYGILLCVFLNATSSGFDGSIMGSINAMTQYKSFFHMKETGSSTGLLFALYTIGNIVGSLFSGPIQDYGGRRVGMRVGAAIIIIGAAIITSSSTRSQFMGGRFILGFGISIATSAAPTYGLEIAPPQWRARIVGFYNSFFYTGSIVATGTVYGTAKLAGTVAWRLPLGMQVGPPIVVFIASFFIPESPRWLCARGRMPEAEKILAMYHGDGDVNHPMVQLEIKEFNQAIAIEKAKPFWDYKDLVNSRNARWRFLMLTFMSYFAQLMGNDVLTYYLPTMFTNVGITSTSRRLLLTFANSIVSWAGALAGSYLNDRVGRITKLWVGSLTLSILLGIVAGISAMAAKAVAGHYILNSHASNAGITFIFLFGFVYSFVYTPLTATYSAEVLTNRSRAKGMGVHVLMSNSAGLYNSYAGSVALGRITWKYYLVFVSIDAVVAAVWFFFGVETKGRTLEELDDIFNAPYPPTASRKVVKVHVTETGGVAAVEEL